MNSQIAAATEDTGLKGACSSCPFNDGITEEASQAQNYGCLPTPGDIVQMKRHSGHNWACHDDESKVCAGLCHAVKLESLDLRSGGLIRYSSWYHAGQQAALDEAATGILVNDANGDMFTVLTEGREYATGFEPPRMHLADLPLYQALQPSEPDNRHLIFATVPSEAEPAVAKCIGLLELRKNPAKPKELTLQYISVTAGAQGTGIAKKLLIGLARYLQDKEALLVRWPDGSEVNEGFRSYVTDFVEGEFLGWRPAKRVYSGLPTYAALPA